MSELWNLWEKLADEKPSKPIIHTSGAGWKTVAQINAEAIGIADSWRNESLAGRIVIMSAPNSPEWLAVFLAIQKSGAIVAAADPSTPAHLLDALAVNLGASRICTGSVLRETAANKKRLFRHDLCLAKITSGSTGVPKAVFFHAREMIADGKAIVEAMGIMPCDVNFALTPFGHSYGLGNLVMPLLMHGCAVVCASSFLPRFAVGDMKETLVTVCPAVPAFYRALNETNLDGGLGRLRLAVSAGSALPASVAIAFEKRFGLRIHNFLGSSETGGIAYDAEGLASLAGSSLGRPMPDVSISQGKDGRLLVGGPAVVSYGNRTRLNGAPAFLLGDRGKLDECGNLVLLGRALPLAKIGGRRVDPLEIEGAIKSFAGVDSAFVRVAQSAGNDRLFALVETNLSAHELRERLRTILPDWKIPRKIMAVKKLERDERGKVKRDEIDELLGISKRS